MEPHALENMIYDKKFIANMPNDAGGWQVMDLFHLPKLQLFPGTGSEHLERKVNDSTLKVKEWRSFAGWKKYLKIRNKL